MSQGLGFLTITPPAGHGACREVAVAERSHSANGQLLGRVGMMERSFPEHQLSLTCVVKLLLP